MPPIDILEIAAARLADARMALHGCLLMNAHPDYHKAAVAVEMARMRLEQATQDMDAVSRVMAALNELDTTSYQRSMAEAVAVIASCGI